MECRFQARETRFANGDRIKRLFVLSRIQLRLRGFADVLRCVEHKIDNAVQPRELLRSKQVHDPVDRCWITELFLQCHQAQQALDTDDSDVPRVPRPPDLSLQVARVLSSHHQQDGGVRLLHLARSDEGCTVARNDVEIDSIRVRSLHLDDKRSTISGGPESIKADLAGCSPIAAVLCGETKPMSDLVNHVLQDLPAAFEAYEAVLRILLQR